MYANAEFAGCAAWVTQPDSPSNGAAVVLVHGFGATHSMALGTYEQAFAAAGFTVVAFDFRHLGASPGEPRQRFEVKTILADVANAVRFARSLDGVERVALWGTSFGASHVLAAAAADPSIAAAVMQCPMIASVRSALGLGVGHMLRLTPAIVSDVLRHATGRLPKYVTLVGRPGEHALVNAPDAHTGWYSLVPEDETFDNRANAGAALEMLRYRADRHAAAVTCPLLVCVSERENLMNPAIAVKAAQDAPRGELLRYDADHWEVYFGALQQRMIADQIAFLTKHLQPREPAVVAASVAA